MTLTAAGAAATPSPSIISVGDESYAVYAADGAATAIQQPLVASLYRNTLRREPDCQFVERALAPLARLLPVCKGGTESRRCADARRLIDEVRFDQGLPGQTRLEQEFWIVTDGSAPEDVAQVTRAAAAAAGVQHERVRLLLEPERASAPGRLEIEIAPDGASWASKLDGWIDLRVPGPSHDPATDGFTTADNILACGVIEGDVALLWQEQIRMPIGEPVLSAARLEQLYRTLEAEPLDASRPLIAQAVALGATIASRLLEQGLPAAQLRLATSFAFDHFYDSSTLGFIALTPEALRGLGEPVSIDPSVSWRARGATPPGATP